MSTSTHFLGSQAHAFSLMLLELVPDNLLLQPVLEGHIGHGETLVLVEDLCWSGNWEKWAFFPCIPKLSVRKKCWQGQHLQQWFSVLQQPL